MKTNGRTLKETNGHPDSRGVSLVSVLALVLILGGVGFLFSYLKDKPLVNSAAVESEPLSPAAKIVIEKIGVDAPVVPVGLTPSNELQVPAKPFDVGWYQYFPTPGEKGPAIMVGHLDSVFGPAVFARLGELEAGDVVTVVNREGEEIKFEVENVKNVEQNNFPTQEVYGEIDYPGLRIITCSGKFNPFKARYSHNLVVFAKKID